MFLSTRVILSLWYTHTHRPSAVPWLCTHMPTATAEWPWVRRLRLGHLGRLATAGPVSWWWMVCTSSLNLALEYTLNHSPGQVVPKPSAESDGSSGAYWVSFRSCNHCSLLKTIIWSLHSRLLSLAPSKQRSRVHDLIEQHLRYVRSESSPRRIQQKDLVVNQYHSSKCAYRNTFTTVLNSQFNITVPFFKNNMVRSRYRPSQDQTIDNH